MDHRTAAVSVRTGRRRLAALAGLVLAAGALTACAGGSGEPSAGSTPVPSATAAGQPSAGSAAPASPSAGASSEPTKPEPRPSTTAAEPNPGIAVGEKDPSAVKLPATGYRLDGTKLTVSFYGGVCDTYGLKVEEDTPPIVKVRVVVTHTRPKDQVCTTEAKLQTVEASIAKPMTGGAVVDTATGQQIPPQEQPLGGPR
ncbi:hypothetical protein [Kitasatospora camelliae]|uniref:Lipoprotein n=1 Tax=Kitasatospora camelliae TaxID=3156397 RepID=A0AAU8JTU7_9ACTN